MFVCARIAVQLPTAEFGADPAEPRETTQQRIPAANAQTDLVRAKYATSAAPAYTHTHTHTHTHKYTAVYNVCSAKLCMMSSQLRVVVPRTTHASTSTSVGHRT